MLNPEIMNELENITEQVQETERKKCSTRDARLRMTLKGSQLL